MEPQNNDMINVEQTEDQFELFYNGQRAGFMEYNKNKEKGLLTITHTEVFEEFGGKGLGKELVEAAVENAKRNNLKIISLCPYAKKMMERTPEFKDLLVE